ncbi:MAG TPA: NAD(P)H-hydrate dehydratase [Telluria sp.]|nr:NAD(P)H-hydrate dehydratase [Telluria sp.]
MPPRAPETIDDALLLGWPLPQPDPDGDKEVRGHVLVLGGSREMPGSIILAATAAMRAGAGKLTIATGASVAQLVALAIPESRVISLPETPDGGVIPGAADLLDPLADRVDALLVGPGMQDESATALLVRALLPRLGRTPVVLDACAMGIVSRQQERFEVPVIVTPHAGEMAHLTDGDKREILADPDRFAMAAAERWNAVVALKGARTVIATPGDGRLWQHEGGNIGLATSGSGDTLAGIVAGLAARGASLAQAACWGVALHARAGERLAARFGVLGYLARDIPAEVPALMGELARRE